ncbi:MAG: right-handed parallel beta-helix repeat-containing protein [Steroidobacteraceae bacterium]
MGPGSYGDQETGSSPYAVVVDKQVTILSREGAESTVINVRDTGRWPVKIFASHVVFGLPGHGFTLVANLNLPFSGISVQEGAADVTIAGNVVSGFTRGIDVAGDHGLIIENTVTGNDEGFNSHGLRNTVTGNLANGNFGVGGMVIGGSGQLLTGNVCNGNTFTGIRVASGAGHRIEDNVAVGNGNEAVSLDAGGRATVTGNDLFGTGSHCGLRNTGNLGIRATGNYWGSAAGPGVAPGDGLCSAAGATTDISGWRRKPVGNPLDRDRRRGHSDSEC